MPEDWGLGVRDSVMWPPPFLKVQRLVLGIRTLISLDSGSSRHNLADEQVLIWEPLSRPPCIKVSSTNLMEEIQFIPAVNNQITNEEVEASFLRQVQLQGLSEHFEVLCLGGFAIQAFLDDSLENEAGCGSSVDARDLLHVKVLGADLAF